MANTLRIADELSSMAEDFASQDPTIFVLGVKFQYGFVKGLEAALLVLKNSRRGGNIAPKDSIRMDLAVRTVTDNLKRYEESR